MQDLYVSMTLAYLNSLESIFVCETVVDVDAQEKASWIDRFLGMVEFESSVVWIMHQSDQNGGLDALKGSMRPKIATTANGMSSLRDIGPHYLSCLRLLDILGSFRRAPFLALRTSNSFLTMLLLLS